MSDKAPAVGLLPRHTGISRLAAHSMPKQCSAFSVTLNIDLHFSDASYVHFGAWQASLLGETIGVMQQSQELLHGTCASCRDRFASFSQMATLKITTTWFFLVELTCYCVLEWQK